MNDLQKYFSENQGRLIHKWQHYFDIYDFHFSRFRDTDVHVVEFGVSHGGSLQMWKHYFGKNAKIYGIDINPHCKQLEEEQIQIFIGDQQDIKFLKSLKSQIPRIDILIDDGGHTMKQQIYTFEELFPVIDKNGVYVCEDLNTSYKAEWGGGYKKRGTFIEYSKNFIDFINAWHSTQLRKLSVSEFSRTVHSLHYYTGMLVIEKRPVEEPTHSKTGTPSTPNYRSTKGILQSIKRRLIRGARRIRQNVFRAN